MTLPTTFTFIGCILSLLYVFGTIFGKHHSIARWAFALSMLGLALESLFLGLSRNASNPIEIGYLFQKRLIAMSFLPGLWILFSATYTRGNQLLSVKKKYSIIGSGLIIPPALAILFRNHILYVGLPSDNNYTIELGIIGYILHLSILLGAIISLMELERTYRTSIGMQRWKIKFMLFGLGLLFTARFYTSSQALLFHAVNPHLDTLNSIALIISAVLISRSIFRPGSFDIDIYPSSTVIGNSLTILIAGGYLIAVGILSKLADWLGGESAFALKAFIILIALSALVILIQSDRFNQSIKSFVSRHFKRPFFDYQSAWMKITEASTQNVDKLSICNAVTREISNILEVKLCNTWLLDNKQTKFTLFASTESPTTSHTIEILDIHSKLKEHKKLLCIDEINDEWISPIKDLNPSAFPNGGKRIAIPLKHQSKLIGLMVLGDRTNGVPFSQPALELITSIAWHLSASLHSAELSKKLADSKELEAFQTIATFFVHDLKNAASTLNLMVKNLPVHWDNPDFRKDAIRGIEKTNRRINKLINNLTKVRSELEIRSTEILLSQFIKKTLDLWKCPEKINFTQIPFTDSQITVDVEKLQSVILNLLINATEATPDTGNITLECESTDNTLRITLSDEGSGMSPQFINESLFKPFCTTKMNGIGIGMFQSKTIIEAHGGQIEVESTIGQGSRFTLSLPQASSPSKTSS